MPAPAARSPAGSSCSTAATCASCNGQGPAEFARREASPISRRAPPPSFNPAHTIFDQVARGGGAARHHEPRAGAAWMRSELFRELELPNPDRFGHRYPHQVSGGQLQRAMAAMAMIAKPDLLVFDEPTTALDVTTQVEVLASFKKLIREHRTAALYISHDLAVVAQIADRIMVLRHGKMVEQGQATQILQQPQRTTPACWWRSARGRRAEQVRREPRRGRPAAARGQECGRRLSRHGEGDRRRLDLRAARRHAGDRRRVGLRQEHAGARHRRPAAARSRATCCSTATSLKRRLQERSKDQLRRIQMIYQMPDVALNPRQTLLDIIGRPVAVLFPQEPGGGARAGRGAAAPDRPAGGLHHPPAA